MTPTPQAAEPRTAGAEDLATAALNGAWLDPVAFALAAAWFLVAARILGAVARDNHRLRIPRNVWSFAAVCGAAASLLPLLAIPFLPVAALFAAGFFLPPVLGYVHLTRNPRVKPQEQILTDEHIGRMGREMLRGLGLAVGDQSDVGSSVRLKPPRAVLRRPDAALAVELLRTTLEEALEVRASDLQIDLMRERASMRRRIDGVWGAPGALELDSATIICDLASKFAALESGDPRKFSVGKFPAKLGRDNASILVTALATVVRRRTTLRLPSLAGPKKLPDLGLADRDSLELAAALKLENGLILVGGPPSSGRRTTLQALVGSLDLQARRVLAVDEPGRPFELPNVVEHFGTATSAADSSKLLRQALSGKCDVLLAGRVDNADAASAVLEAAADRLVLAAIDAENAIAGLVKLIELGGGRDALAERLRVAVAQRLPRKLCNDCREAYRPSPDALRRANLGRPVADVLYRVRPDYAAECETCHGVGYVGCAALFETLTMTPRMRGLLRAGAGERELLLEARKEGSISPTEAALAFLAAGKTSADELRRVLQTTRADKEDA